MEVESSILIAAVIVALIISIFGMFGVLSVLKRTQRGFGANSARTFAVAIFVPIVLIIATVTSLAPEAIAALLGTLAGYIFAKSDKE